MIKFFRKKLLEGMIKDIMIKMPEYKDFAILLFEEHKSEIYRKVKEAIKTAIKNCLSEHLK